MHRRDAWRACACCVRGYLCLMFGLEHAPDKRFFSIKVACRNTPGSPVSRCDCRHTDQAVIIPSEAFPVKKVRQYFTTSSRRTGVVNSKLGVVLQDLCFPNSAEGKISGTHILLLPLCLLYVVLNNSRIMLLILVCLSAVADTQWPQSACYSMCAS